MHDEQHDIIDLLIEIRDTQREHLAAYREQAQRAISLQELAVAKQQQIARVYYVVIAVLAVVIACALYKLIF
jgi:type VI protein secretion system component VasF